MFKLNSRQYKVESHADDETVDKLDAIVGRFVSFDETLESDFLIDMSMDPNYGIIRFPSFQVDIPEYEERVSLEYLLIKIGIDVDTAKKVSIIERRDKLFNTALIVSDEFENKRFIPEISCHFEARRVAERLLIKFIAGKVSESECVELCFMYFLLKLGDILRHGLGKYIIYSSDWQHLIAVLSSTDYRGILKFFDMDVISCFGYYISKNGSKIHDIMNYGYDHIRMNVGNSATSHGSLYLVLGEQTVVELINRVVQVIIDYGKFSFDGFLKIQPAIGESRYANRYNIAGMKKHSEYPHGYLFGSEERKTIQNDIRMVLSIINDSEDVKKKFDHLDFETINIDYDNIATRLQYPIMTYGKKSVHPVPYRVVLFTKDKTTCLTIGYDHDQEIVDFKHTGILNGKHFEIVGRCPKGDKLRVTRIK